MSGDILDQIDQSLDGIREQFCCCGCGAELRTDGPSFYYATQDCQQRALRAKTANPEVVEARRDYSSYSDGSLQVHHAQLAGTGVSRAWQRLLGTYDAGPAPYYFWEFSTAPHTEPSTTPWPAGWNAIGHTSDETVTARHSTNADPEAAPQLPQRIPPPDYLTYRRRCDHCGHVGAVIVHTEREDIYSFSQLLAMLETAHPTTTHSCGNCAGRFTDQVQGAVARLDDGWLLNVSDGRRFTRHFLTDTQLDHAWDPADYVRELWQRMTDDLTGQTWQPSFTYHLDHNIGQRELTFRIPPGQLLLDHINRHYFNFNSEVPAPPAPTGGEPQTPMTAAQLRRAATAAAAESELSDPRARALWLRQHRNTGPDRRGRAPRAINPRRAR